MTPRTAPRVDTDLTVQAASDEELRRRASEGDQRAAAELARRGSMLVQAGADANRLRVGRDQAAGKKMPTASQSTPVAVSCGGKRFTGQTGDLGRMRATALVA